MKRNAAGGQQVRDFEGVLWDVRDIRNTKYGFDLLFGRPVPRQGKYNGPTHLIATRQLVDFWEANRTNHDGVIMDLPAGRTTLKRMRRRLGFHYFKDLSRFWLDRIGDLETLPAREFAERHNIELEVVFETRRKLLGNWARDPDWWLKPRHLKVLRSGITLREIGEELGISITHAKRLRDRALALQ